MITVARIQSLTTLVVFLGFGVGGVAPAFGQEPDPDRYLVRPAPPALDDFEHDENKDGLPDGWYNARDVKVMTEGGAVKPHYLKFESAKVGRPSRLSRAFGVDGKKYEAIVIGMWIRLDQIQSGERLGEEPGLMIDFLGDQLRQVSRGTMGPWTARNVGAATAWTHIAKRIPVPPTCKDAIMSIGLLGATGVLDVDGVTFDLIPIGGSATTNMIRNGDFELGDSDPNGWSLESGARKISPGYRSKSCVDLSPSRSRALTGLALPVDRYSSIEVSAAVKGTNLRGAGGASGRVFFLDELGNPLEPSSGVRLFLWSGSFDWKVDRAIVSVPRGAERAVVQFEREGAGSLKLDEVTATASPDAEASAWVPFHIENDVTSWLPVKPSTGVMEGSALDFSFLVDGPAGKHGHVVSKNGRLNFAKGGRARFFGVQILPPYAFLAAAKASALADRLARSGVNLVRLGDLDTPLGPDRSLFDDTRDDTKAFDPIALNRLDELVAALKSRGIYVAFELQGGRRFRSEDGVRMPGALRAGGGPEAVFDPTIAKLTEASAREFLARENPITSLTYRSDPAVAWVTLAGEVTLFDMTDPATDLPGDYGKEYRELAAKSPLRDGKRFKQAIDSAHWKRLGDALKADGLKAPLASVSHWRRDHEFNESLAAPGLDLIDDRIYWMAPSWIAPRYRSMLWSLDGGLLIDSARKRHADRPYVVGQYCNLTQGVWATPYESAEQILAATTAVSEDWDALVRRGLFMYPVEWGSAAPGTVGGEDIFQLPEIANASPQIFALWPHASSIMLRGHEETSAEKPKEKAKTKVEPAKKSRLAGRSRKPGQQIPGWDPAKGRLVVETPFTQGVAGWPAEEAVAFDHLAFDVESPFATVLASSAGKEPIELTKRLLVTAVARVSPTGFKWVDDWRRETADPGIPPLLAEPVVARVTWKHSGTIAAYALDNNGARIGPAKVEKAEGGITLILDGKAPSLHYELVAE